MKTSKNLPLVVLCSLLAFACLPVLLIGANSASEDSPLSEVAQHKCIDCKECHISEQPTEKDPALIPRTCPRHDAMLELDAELGPGMIILDEIENLYEPVRFDHLKHAEMVGISGGCETCHHHTPPDTPHPTCKGCHPVSTLTESTLLPGLKRAYHRNCMGCHSEWDNETSCVICHQKKGAGSVSFEPTHSYYKRIELEELIIFKTGYAEGDEVPFHHQNHSRLYERSCVECHQEQSCDRCHIQDGELHPMGTLEDADFHDTCFKCHGDEECENCHGRSPDDLFKHESTGWELKVYHAQLHCRDCHGKMGPFLKLNPDCTNCHAAGWVPSEFDHKVTGVELVGMHKLLECAKCHVNGVEKEPVCTDCH